MKNICIIGFGSIGKYVFKNLIQDNIKIKSLICRHGREEEGKQALCSNLEISYILDMRNRRNGSIWFSAGKDQSLSQLVASQ